MFSGKLVCLESIQAEDICVEDIARSLALQCRFNGHVREHYSVAQHSVLVSEFCDPADALWGLLHDASETYVSDLPAPVKQLDKISGPFSEIENLVQAAICAKFGLPLREPDSVRETDKVLAYAEILNLMPALPPSARASYLRQLSGARVPKEIGPWPASRAQEEFLCRFAVLAP